MSLNPARPPRIGNLRHKITWQEQITVEGDFNDIVTWVDRETEPARVEPLKGSEQFATDELIARQNVRVFARFRHVPNTADWRLLWVTGAVTDGVAERLVLDILAVTNPDERRRYIEVLCTNTRSQVEPDG